MNCIATALRRVSLHLHYATTVNSASCEPAWVTGGNFSHLGYLYIITIQIKRAVSTAPEQWMPRFYRT